MFFIVEFKIYRLGQPARRRLLRPNVPAIEETERWVHCKVPHRDPASVARARPDRLHAGGLQIGTRGGSWEYDGELDVWIFVASDCTEDHAATLNMSRWSPGRYKGEPSESYRLPAMGGARDERTQGVDR